MPSLGRAALFDWDQSYGTWTAGAPSPGNTASQAYDINSDGINDVTISIANSASNPSTGGGRFTWLSGYPTVDKTTNTGGLSPAQNALQFDISQGNPAGITVTIKFTTAVTNLSFTLFDVDRSAGTFQDNISSIQGLTSGSATIAATSVTTSIANTSTGSGLGLVVFGTATSTSTSSNANVTINFGTNRVTQVSFVWKNTDAALGTQAIALHDISFTPLPEVGSSLTAITMCGGAIGFGLLKKRKRTK